MALGDQTPIWRRVGQEALDLIDGNFGQRSGPQDKWVPRKRHYPWPILEMSGALREKIKARPDRRGVTLVSSLPYSAAHQYGYKDNNLPARPYLWISESDLRMIGELVGKRLEIELES